MRGQEGRHERHLDGIPSLAGLIGGMIWRGVPGTSVPGFHMTPYGLDSFAMGSLAGGSMVSCLRGGFGWATEGLSG